MRQQLAALLVILVALSAIGPAVAGATTAPKAAVQESDAQCEYPLTMTDATGEEVTIESEPESVVTLYPGDAQLAYSIGAEGKVVGMPVSQYTESLDAGDRTDITDDDGVTPVAEEIVALNPDVVLAANIANQDLLETLEDAGITVVVLDTATSLDGVRENVRVTGQVTGECESAEETVQWMDERLEIYEEALANESAPLAYYDGGENGETHGTETFQHEVMTAAGLENLAAEVGESGWMQMNSEVVVNEDPEWIVYPDSDNWDAPPSTANLDGVTAIREDNVVAVDDNAMSQPGPNVVYAIETIIEEVHPDVYSEIEGDLEAVDEEYRDDGNESDDGSDSGEENESAIPGFGVVAGLIALLAAAGFVVRRQ